MATASPTGTGKLIVEYGNVPDPGGGSAIPIDIINARFEVVEGLLQLDGTTGFDLLAGPYQVRATLPSGEILSTQARVEPGGTSRVSLWPRQPSPRESLAWAYSLKQLDPLALRSSRDEIAGLMPGFDWAESKFEFDLWRRDPTSAWGIAEPTTEYARILHVDDSVRGVEPNALTVLKLELPAAGGFPDDQPILVTPYWLQTRGSKAPSRFTALPVPSMPVRGMQLRVLVVRDDNEEPDFDPISVLANSGNPRAEALLGYLATGAFEAAHRVSEDVLSQAESMLKSKRDDPASAAIGGYYILRAGRLERLHDWSRNMDRWFPLLADGAVIHAWHLMGQPRPDLALARERLLEAEQRGLPQFTQGLRLLFDGLDFFAHKTPRDEPIVQARDRLRLYARAANWRSLTTTFYGEHPTRPALPTRGATSDFEPSPASSIPADTSSREAHESLRGN